MIAFQTMEQHTLIEAGSLPDCRKFLFSWGAVERFIEADSYWQKYGRAFPFRYIADAITRQRLAVADRFTNTIQKVNLHSRILKIAIGDRYYREALNLLIGAKIIESDHRYRIGKKAIGYGPTKSTWRSKIVPVVMSATESARYAKAHALLRKQSDKRRRHEGIPLDYLRHHLDRLDFAPGAAEEILLDLEKRAHTWQRAERYHYASFSVARIVGRDWTFTRCRAGRLHYAITSTSRPLRGALRYQGESLIEIDVGACQPLLASTFYSEIPGSNPERNLYLTDVTVGRFYETLAGIAGITGREEAKKQMMPVLFGGIKVATSAQLWPAFENRYPRLAEELLRRKASIPVKGERSLWRDGDTETAIELQRAESQIFIDGVLNRIASNTPEIPALPIHDGILTTEAGADLIEALIRAEFIEQLGVDPSITRK